MYMLRMALLRDMKLGVNVCKVILEKDLSWAGKRILFLRRL